MSFRRFLYVVWDVECIDGSSSLRRIDTSRFFFLRGSSDAGTPVPLNSSAVCVGAGSGAVDPSAVHDGGRLPDPVLKLHSPILPRLVGETGFLLFKNKGVVAVDRRGTSFMFDDPEEEEDSPAAALTTIRPLPAMATPKLSPFSITVGESLYVMDSYPVPINGGGRHSFEVLTYADHHCPIRRIKDWCWRPLDPPPLVDHPDKQFHSVDSYAVDAGGSGGILVSNHASRRTYRFDTASETWSKIAGDGGGGEWVLPFTNLAEYLPEHGLWFGISSGMENDDEDYCFCAADFSPSSSLPPVVRGVWKEYTEPPPPGWVPALSYAVYLGNSKFCIVRFFYTGKVYVCPESRRSYSREEDLHVVITGVEVRGGGGGGGGGDVQVLRHKSERYKVDVRLYYNLL